MLGGSRWVIRVGALLRWSLRARSRFTTAVQAPAAADDGTIVFGAALAATGSNAREGALTKEGYDFWKTTSTRTAA